MAMNAPEFRATQIIPLIKKQTGQANVNGTALKNMLIPLPPLPEQHRIVAKVDELMALCDRLEQRLPSRSGIAIAVCFEKNFAPNEEALRKVSVEHGYEIARGTLSITFRDGHPEWHFLAVARDKRKGAHVADLAKMMSQYKGNFGHARSCPY